MIPLYHPGSREHKERLARCHPATFREIITYISFEAVNRETMEKPAFLFRDIVLVLDEAYFKEESKWLHQIRDLHIFLSDIERCYSLVYL